VTLSRFFRRRPTSTVARRHSPVTRWRPDILVLEDRTVPSMVSAITASFNGTAIPAGRTIWFSSAFTASGLPKTGSVTIHVEDASIDFTAGGTAYHVPVPNGVIVLTAGANSASASYDPGDNDWDVSAPTGGTGDVFMGGVAVPVTTALPGGIKNVTWSASFWSDTANVTVNWKWSASVYSNFSSDYNALNVKPVDNKDLSAYHSADQSDTPEAYKAFVVAGALGGGGNNYTGNFTGGKSVKPTLGNGLQDYPYASSNPLTSVAFNESSVLRAANLDTVNGYLDVWYNDEHALTLGVRQVNVTTSSGTTTTNYSIASLSGNPGSATNPDVGASYTPSTNQTTLINEGGTDTSGRPMTPMLFITDITNNPNDRSGDWQWGGAGYAPSQVYGTWKAAVKTVNYTTATPTVTVSCDADPAKNNWNLGTGADAPPAGLSNEGYGAEIRWNLNDLYAQGVLQAGHTYRFYVMVHDGDQNKSGGDSGQASYTFSYPGPTNPPPTQNASLSGYVYLDSNRNGVRDSGESPLSGITITLTGFDAIGNPVSVATVTLDDGSYTFTGLAAGTYQLTEDLPPFIPHGTNAVGTVNGTADGSLVGNSAIGSITLLSGDVGSEYDFAALPPGS
jgi:SdrD B-like domain